MRGKLKSIADREKIREAVASGTSQRRVAKELGVARETVRKYAKPRG